MMILLLLPLVVLPVDCFRHFLTQQALFLLLDKKWAEASPTRDAHDPQIIGAYIKIEKGDMEKAFINNNFGDLMLHEFGHVVGVGTRWNEDDLDSSYKLIDAASKTYTGTNGLAAWNTMGCTGELPLAPSNDHWNEDCLFNEVMTPKLKFQHKALVSPITMGALEDLGYEVNRDEQDDFNLSNLGSCGNFCPAAAGSRHQRRLGESLDETTELSEAAELSLLHSAVKTFGSHARLLEKESDPFSDRVFVRDSVSYIYEENGHYFSRTIHKHQVEHLMQP